MVFTFMNLVERYKVLRDFQREMTNAYNLDVAQKQNLQEKTQQEEAVKTKQQRKKKETKQTETFSCCRE